MGIPITCNQQTQTAKKVENLYVELWVTDEYGNRARFKLKRRCPLWVLFEAYCSRRKLNDNVKFMFAGREVLPTDTPEVVGEKVKSKLIMLAMKDIATLLAVASH
eukprot:jgi/Galph1/2455/GphlegSOOS_G1097.1